MNTAPKVIRENVARAKGYLRRDEIPRALEAMSTAIRDYAEVTLFKQARFELTVQFDEFLLELARHPTMQVLLDPERTGKPRKITFQAGKEKILATVLDGLAKILLNAQEAEKDQEDQALQQRKIDLIETGKARIMAGDIARGRSFMKRAAAEFGDQAGVLMEVGRCLFALEQYADAAEMFEANMNFAPKDPEAYTEGIQAYIMLMEYEKAESIYFKIFKQFGGHANTYGRLAQLYLTWGKRIKADEFAHRALQLDAEQSEALEVVQSLSSR